MNGHCTNFSILLLGNIKLEMIWLNPGSFMMGSPENELGRSPKEILHEVTLTKGYWLGKYPVTQEQYTAVMSDNPSYFNGDKLPVESVSWQRAIDFCTKLTEMERKSERLPKGYKYTLPTEAQWEYACRAGTSGALNSGKDLKNKEKCPEMEELGWYRSNCLGTHPVGEKQSNAWGFYDMHGNVWEWCLDWFGDYSSTAMKDPTGPDKGTVRIVRGGGWYSCADSCRSAFRHYFGPSYSSSIRGFRVALSSN